VICLFFSLWGACAHKGVPFSHRVPNREEWAPSFSLDGAQSSLYRDYTQRARRSSVFIFATMQNLSQHNLHIFKIIPNTANRRQHYLSKCIFRPKINLMCILCNHANHRTSAPVRAPHARESLRSLRGQLNAYVHRSDQLIARFPYIEHFLLFT